MSPIEEELFADFRSIMLEVLVPLEVQRRMPGIREHWRVVLASKAGDKAFRACFARFSRERRSIGESIRESIARESRYKEVVVLKDALYARLGRDRALIASFFDRPITNGNEECPYWNGFGYQRAPNKPE